jgi:UDP-glucose 4-epimerase
MSPQHMRILITGANGFIGKHLVWRLEPKNDLFCLCRRTSEFPSMHRSTYISYDLTRTIDIDVLPRKIDVVVHLAAVSKHGHETNRERMFRINTGSTIELLEYASRAGAKSFVYASTGGVYGYRSEPIRETCEANPVEFLAATKYASEIVAKQYESDLDVIILRYFFPYGPNQTHHLIQNLTRKIARGEAITVYNYENPITNPIYISDVVEATVRATMLDRPIVLNIAGKERASIRTIAEMLGDFLGKSPAYRRVDDPKTCNIIGDIANMESLLGFLPQVDLRTGLKRTVEAWSVGMQSGKHQ